MKKKFASIPDAIEAIARGEMIILVDDENRENEGDLMCAAEFATPEAVNFMAKEGRGLICLSMTGEALDRLEVPLMTSNNSSKLGTAFTLSIEAAKGVTTGISAEDRSQTIQVAIDENSGPKDIIVPGHIFPLRAKPGGVLVRAGQTEGSVDLAYLAGLNPSAVICEIMNDNGTMARVPDLEIFAKKHNLLMVSVNDLIAYRIATEVLVEETSEAMMPLEDFGQFTVKVFKGIWDDAEHLAFIKTPMDTNKAPLVRLHSECLTGDTFGSQRCDCGAQRKEALRQISIEGGVLLYMRQEGRGIGIGNKIKAYALQDTGLDTVEANHRLGFDADHRHYGMSAQILRALGLESIRLLTNNPRKVSELEGYGVARIERIPLEIAPTKHNARYLKAKAQKLGHILVSMS